jgi:hypothetical protein
VTNLLATIQSGRQPKPPRVLIYGVEGIGKAQPIDANVLTPNGFVAMGDITEGDEVIGADGQPCKVLGVYPQGIKDVFEVTFRDGSKTRCCDDHLWFTATCNERTRKLVGAVRTLADIRKSLRYGTHFNHAVPRVKAVQFAEKLLPFHPWLLGMYLGDGNYSGCLKITNSEGDIQSRIRKLVEESGDLLVMADQQHMRVTSNDRSGSDFKAKIDLLGLSQCKAETKFVPEIFLHGSVEQRIQLLRGLIDSDGFVTHPGSIEYATVSEQLSSDFCFLVRSLGGSARVTTKRGSYLKEGVRHECQLVYRIFASFPSDIQPVSSDKHLAKWGTAQWRIHHTIRDVKRVGKMECQCIRIDALDSLYVTDDFILTHNSTIGSQAPKPIFIQTEDGLDEIECDRFPLATKFDDVIAALKTLVNEKHDYETVVVDSLDWLERLVWDKLCRQYGVESIEKVDGGYARGYMHALSLWREVIDLLGVLRSRGMVVILIAHSKVERFEDPESSPYDRYSPRLHKHAAALLNEWCDAVLFATRRMRVQSEDGGFARKRTIAHAIGKDGGERIMRAFGSPSCVAKNRYGIAEELPLSWSAFVAAMSN